VGVLDVAVVARKHARAAVHSDVVAAETAAEDNVASAIKEPSVAAVRATRLSLLAAPPKRPVPCHVEPRAEYESTTRQVKRRNSSLKVRFRKQPSSKKRFGFKEGASPQAKPNAVHNGQTPCTMATFRCNACTGQQHGILPQSHTALSQQKRQFVTVVIRAQKSCRVQSIGSNAHTTQPPRASSIG
jgi:hypothetical protein